MILMNLSRRFGSRKSIRKRVAVDDGTETTTTADEFSFKFQQRSAKSTAGFKTKKIGTNGNNNGKSGELNIP